MSKIDEMLKNEKVEWKKLGDVCEIKRGVRVTKNDLIKNGKYPVVSGGIGYMGYINKYNRDEDTITIAQYGSAGYVNWQNEKFWANDVCFCLFPKKEIKNKYLYYFLLNKQYYLYSITNKDAVPYSISKEKIAKIDVAIPKLEVQKKIVNYLDEFINYAEIIKQKLQKEFELRNRQYEYYRDKLLSEEYLNKLINKYDLYKYDLYKYELKETTLGDLAQVNRGASPRPISNFITNSEDGVPWIKISDAGLNSKYINQTMQRITREGAKKSRLLKKGDFIISNSMSYGRPYILAIEGCIHDGWAAISEYEENLNSDFLYHYLNSNKVQNYWLKKMNTSSVSNLNSDIIKSLPIPLIDKNLQAKIAEILDKFQALTQYVSGLLPEEIEKREKQYEYYREKLLTFDTKCTSGGGYHLLSKDYISLLTQAGALVGVKVFEIEYVLLKDISVYSSDKIDVTELNEENYVGVDNLLKDKLGKVNSNNLPKTGNVNLFNEGDILLGNIRPYLRKIWLADINGGASPDVLVISLKDNEKKKVLAKYLYQVLSSEDFFDYDIKFSRGAKMPRGNKSKIMDYKILIPPLPIQEYIVSILDKFEALSQSTTEGLRREIELREKQYEYYREKLLTFEK